MAKTTMNQGAVATISKGKHVAVSASVQAGECQIDVNGHKSGGLTAMIGMNVSCGLQKTSTDLGIHHVSKVIIGGWERLDSTTVTRKIVTTNDDGSKTIITLFKDDECEREQ
jgi:hypothetical protein